VDFRRQRAAPHACRCTLARALRPRWPRAGRQAGAVAQQTLASGAVGGLDAHRAVHGEATAMRPLPHRPRGIARQQAAAHENAQQPPGRTCACNQTMALASSSVATWSDPARGGGVEHAVDDNTVEVQRRLSGNDWRGRSIGCRKPSVSGKLMPAFSLPRRAPASPALCQFRLECRSAQAWTPSRPRSPQPARC